MKIIYFLKNLKITKDLSGFILKKTERLKKFLKERTEEGLVEVELIKDKESKFKKGLYKAKIILDFPKKSLIVAKGIGKNLVQAINSSFAKLFRQLRKKS